MNFSLASQKPYDGFVLRIDLLPKLISLSTFSRLWIVVSVNLLHCDLINFV